MAVDSVFQFQNGNGVTFNYSGLFAPTGFEAEETTRDIPGAKTLGGGEWQGDGQDAPRVVSLFGTIAGETCLTSDALRDAKRALLKGHRGGAEGYLIRNSDTRLPCRVASVAFTDADSDEFGLAAKWRVTLRSGTGKYERVATSSQALHLGSNIIAAGGDDYAIPVIVLTVTAPGTIRLVYGGAGGASITGEIAPLAECILTVAENGVYTLDSAARPVPRAVKGEIVNFKPTRFKTCRAGFCPCRQTRTPCMCTQVMVRRFQALSRRGIPEPRRLKPLWQ